MGNKHSALRYTMHTSVWFICMGEGEREGEREGFQKSGGGG